MINEITELLDLAMDREIASEAFYIGNQKKTQDPGAIELMRELAQQEAVHLELIRQFKEKGLDVKEWDPKIARDLKVGEYLMDVNLTEGASLQDIMTAAIKREQYSKEFYAEMKRALKGKASKEFCERLIKEETNHKMRLETFYDNLFYKED